MMLAGLNGGARSGAAAVADGTRLVGVCAQERVTRVRGLAGTAGLPTDALDLLLRRGGHTRADVAKYVVVDGEGATPGPAGATPLGHHHAHASTAYRTSPFPAAAIVICDHEAPGTSVWLGAGREVTRREWLETGPGFAPAYTRVAAGLGFHTGAAEQRLEGLARLEPAARDARVDALFGWRDGRLEVDPALEERLEAWAGAADDGATLVRARLAASAQARLADLLLEFLHDVRQRLGVDRLCVGGTLFHRSFITTRIRRAGIFAEVFVPVDPGNSGLAVGAVLDELAAAPAPVSPFLGPSYSAEDVKAVLDNCKLQYSWESEGGVIAAAVQALREGHLVGWFDGGMEWGPRALGARSILASPTQPYVLENLNHFLKQREPWRGYALAGSEAAVAEHFEGPERAPFMECDYTPRDPGRFRHVLPTPGAAVRVQTVGDGALPRFARLLDALGDDSGLPFVVNTSFNGFHEPIVCSPRDAVRVFYGSGLDLLVMHQFVLRK